MEIKMPLGWGLSETHAQAFSLSQNGPSNPSDEYIGGNLHLHRRSVAQDSAKAKKESICMTNLNVLSRWAAALLTSNPPPSLLFAMSILWLLVFCLITRCSLSLFLVMVAHVSVNQRGRQNSTVCLTAHIYCSIDALFHCHTHTWTLSLLIGHGTKHKYTVWTVMALK